MRTLATIHSLFFFNDTATTEIYTLSLHDALPICGPGDHAGGGWHAEARHAGARRQEPQHHLRRCRPRGRRARRPERDLRSEEHTSELQSQSNLVCRLLLEKKK